MIFAVSAANTYVLKRGLPFSSGIAQTIGFLRIVFSMKVLQVDVDSVCLSSISGENLHVVPSIAERMDNNDSLTKVQCTPEIEKKYVHQVYDAIAPHFSSTRFAKWPKVQMFLNSLSSGSLILDAGCGNGKYLGLIPNCYFIGCDISAPLIGICADKKHEVLVADAINLPYRTGFGDAAISIAVLHHLSTEYRRKKAVEELVRIVKKGGLVLITVWAREQEDTSLIKKWTPLPQKYSEERMVPDSQRIHNPSSSLALESIPETDEKISSCQSKYFISESSNEDIKNLKCPISVDGCNSLGYSNRKTSAYQQEYFVPWHLPYHRAEISGASSNAVASGFARKDDKKGAVIYDRYYHVFGEGELESLVSGVDGAIIVAKFYDKSNWCIILEKISP